MALTRNDKKVMAVAVAVAVVLVGALTWWRFSPWPEQEEQSAAPVESAPVESVPVEPAPVETPPQTSQASNPGDAAQALSNATEPSQEPNATQPESPQPEQPQETSQPAQAEPSPQVEPSPPAAVTHDEKKVRRKSGPARSGAHRRVVEGITVTETAKELAFTLHGTAGAPKPHVMVLSSPPRLVADLEGSWMYQGGAQPKNPLVAGIRSGNTPGRLRIVADLAAMPAGRPVVETSPAGIVIRINKPVRK